MKPFENIRGYEMNRINGKRNIPTRQEVMIYFDQRGIPGKEAITFYDFYTRAKWKNKNGSHITKWKEYAYRRIAAIVRDNSLFFNRRIH